MKMFDCNYIHSGFIFIPCPGMTPGGLRAQYLIPNLTPKCECLSIHSSLLLGPLHHAIPRNQCKQSLCRTEANCRPQASLPNLLKKSSSAGRDFFTKLGPQIRLSPIPIFGVNNEKCENAFQTLKQYLTSAPVLAQPDNSKPYEVYCDASGTGMGCVLMQEN
jgi:hypothetical protein